MGNKSSRPGRQGNIGESNINSARPGAGVGQGTGINNNNNNSSSNHSNNMMPQHLANQYNNNPRQRGNQQSGQSNASNATNNNNNNINTINNNSANTNNRTSTNASGASNVPSQNNNTNANASSQRNNNTNTTTNNNNATNNANNDNNTNNNNERGVQEGQMVKMLATIEASTVTYNASTQLLTFYITSICPSLTYEIHTGVKECVQNGTVFYMPNKPKMEPTRTAIEAPQENRKITVKLDISRL